MTSLNFTKMHALSNDFMVIDQTCFDYQLNKTTIQKLANRHTGVGFDQLLIVEKSNNPQADFHYRIFNADASEVAQCGNGVRCFARFVLEKGLSSKKQMTVSTNAGLMQIAVLADDSVRVDMGFPNFEPKDVGFVLNAKNTKNTENSNNEAKLTYHLAGQSFGITDIGNPHCTLVVKDIKTAEVEKIGVLLMSHPNFKNRVNVGFMQIINQNQIKLRVYERGVGETKACGSGACAAVSYGVRLGLLSADVLVNLLGGDLNIHYDLGGTITMQGEAIFVYDGVVK